MSSVCCKKVWGNHSYTPHACANAAKFEVDGKHYCGIHNPNKAQTKAQIEAEENRKIQAKKYKLERAAPDLLEAAQRVLSNKRGEDDWLILAVHCQDLAAAIAKATGEAT